MSRNVIFVFKLVIIFCLQMPELLRIAMVATSKRSCKRMRGKLASLSH
jgi:hypothetical protein